MTAVFKLGIPSPVLRIRGKPFIVGSPPLGRLQIPVQLLISIMGVFSFFLRLIGFHTLLYAYP